VQHVS